MIIDNIKYCEKYYPLHPDFKEAFEFLKNLCPDSESGVTQLENVRVSVGVTGETSDTDAKGEPKVYETHRRMVDIHYIIDGDEDMGCAVMDNLEPICDYNCEGDYTLYMGHLNRVNLRKGDFIICFPEDAHMPSLRGHGGDTVQRAIAKIKTER